MSDISVISAMSFVDDVSVVVIVEVEDEVTQGLAALTSFGSHPRSAPGLMKVWPPLESVTMHPGQADAVIELPVSTSTLRQPSDSVTSSDVEYEEPAPMVAAQVASALWAAEANRVAEIAKEKRTAGEWY